MQRRFIFAAIIFLALVAAGFAQKPKITNAKIQEISAASNLKLSFDAIVQKQQSPAWIAYRIPTETKERTMCCFDSWNEFRAGDRCCMGCRLESGGGSFSGTMSDCQPLEPFSYAFVFLRVEEKQVKKIRTYSPDCALDAGGLPLYWLGDVNPGQSVAMLGEIALAANPEGVYRKKDLSQQAVRAIALHDDAAADGVLEKLIQPGQPDSTREQAAFWLGAERGKKGVETLRKYVKSDPSDHFRERAVVGFARSKEPAALTELIAIARTDPSPRVRGQAIFWLAQAGGKKEAVHITDAIANDPETEVKKKAVFALSQLPHEDGIPLLISVARTNKNPVVRKQAIFWLGQTHDPRALDFLEEILKR